MTDVRIGIDIGGTKVAYALGDAEGRLQARYQRATECSGSAQQDLKRMAADLRRFTQENGVEISKASVLGVSVPGPLERAAGRVLHPPNLPGWGIVPVAEILAAEFNGCRVEIENDANAAALAEARYGAGQGHANLIYLTMSTGVGAGLVLDGRIYRGRNSLAGEVGHAPVEWPGELCACGLRGCLEAYVGGAAWMRRLRDIAPLDSGVVTRAGGRENATPEHVVQAAQAGDAFALAEMDRFNGYLARSIAQLQFVLAPDVIVLGTIAVAAGEALCFAPLREKVRSLLWPGIGDDLIIVPAQLGSELAYHAALCAAG
jgi:glucokinase